MEATECHCSPQTFPYAYCFLVSYMHFPSQDEIIYIHRKWVPEKERKIFPQNLHIQFHGREMHSLCFVSKNTLVEANGKNFQFDRSSWIATGCEDGTVRLTR